MRKLFICITLALLVAIASACQAEPTPIVLPTLVEMSTDESEATATVSEETATVEATDEAEVTETEEATDEVTATTAAPRASRTPTPTPTNTFVPATTRPTVAGTPDVAASSTAAIEEAPVFATITAAPPNSQVQPTTTPIIVADVVITEVQFQEELDLRITEFPDMQSAFVNFTPEGVVLTLTASGGDALITGEVTILFQVDGGLVYISIGAVDVNAAQIPDAYAQSINNLYQVVIETMDGILRQRLGNLTDLENIIFTDSAMNITLLVPLDVATNTP
jgi:hypothetical protein